MFSFFNYLITKRIDGNRPVWVIFKHLDFWISFGVTACFYFFALRIPESLQQQLTLISLLGLFMVSVSVFATYALLYPVLATRMPNFFILCLWVQTLSAISWAALFIYVMVNQVVALPQTSLVFLASYSALSFMTNIPMTHAAGRVAVRWIQDDKVKNTLTAEKER